MAEYWTTEQVAAHLKIEVRDVYQSRRNGDWPGIVGKQRGRRLLFRSDLIEAGPSEPESTNDPQVAILWTLQGIEAKLADILGELRKPSEQVMFGPGIYQIIEEATGNSIKIEGEQND